MFCLFGVFFLYNMAKSRASNFKPGIDLYCWLFISLHISRRKKPHPTLVLLANLEPFFYYWLRKLIEWNQPAVIVCVAVHSIVGWPSCVGNSTRLHQDGRWPSQNMPEQLHEWMFNNTAAWKMYAMLGVRRGKGMKNSILIPKLRTEVQNHISVFKCHSSEKKLPHTFYLIGRK